MSANEEKDLDRLLAVPQHMAEFNAPVLSDLGNAERFIFLFGDRVRYCPPQEKWYVWDGRRWKKDDMRTVELLAARVPQAIYDEASMQTDPEIAKAYRRWANSTAMTGRIKALLERSAVRDEIAVTPETFDSKLWLLNLENGTFELKEGVFREHRKKDMITCLAAVNFEPDAAYGNFLNFVSGAMGNGEGGLGMLSWLQRFLGYCLAGDTSEQRFGLFCGKSETGKSTLLNIIRDTLGSDYAGVIRSKSLFDPYDRESEHDFNHVASCRLVTASEGKEGSRLPEDFIKAITGAETLSMREMHKGAKEWHPHFKLVLGTNFKPTISEGGNAVWRRMVYVPFENKIEKRDNKFAEKVLRDERPGVLKWLLAGLADYLKGPLGFDDPPEMVANFVKDYRSEEDIVGDFLANDCQVYDDKKPGEPEDVQHDTLTPFGNLYAVFRHNLLEMNEEYIISSKKFAARLDVAGIRRGDRIGQKRLKSRVGIRLSASGEEKLREVEELKSRKRR